MSESVIDFSTFLIDFWSINAPVIYSIITALVSLFFIFYIYIKYKHGYWRRRGVYSPPTHWFFGNFREFFLLRKSPPDVLEDIYNSVDKNVPLIGFYIFYKPFLLVRDPELIKDVMIKDFNVFPNHNFTYKQKTDIVTSKNLFSIKNPEWKYLRTKLSPMFTTGKQKRLFLLMLETAENLKNYLESKIKDTKTSLETKSIATRFTIDVISSLTFGVRTNSFMQPESEFFQRITDFGKQKIITGIRIFMSFFFPERAHIFRGKMLGAHTEYFRSVFWDSITHREKSGDKRGDAIDLLLELKNNSRNSELFNFDGDYLFAQSAILMVAGNATSSMTMIYTLMELAKNPEIQERLQEELLEKIPVEGLTYECIPNLTYLHQVVSETLRIYPPAPVIDRVANEKYKFAGTNVTIEKDTALFVILPGIHKDKNYHSDPLKYNPERFSPENKASVIPFTYMPFGDGPRVCIGMRTGLLQTMVGLITILSKYRVSLNPEYKNETSKTAIFLAPENEGINLYFEKLFP